MRLTIPDIFIFSMLTYCSSALADDNYRPTMILGKQQTGISDYGKIHGMTFMMRLENTSPWSVIGKLTATKNSWQNEPDGCKRGNTQCQKQQRENFYKGNNAEYFSALGGPAYRLTRQISAFGLAGYAYSVVDNPSDRPGKISDIVTYSPHGSGHFAYSVGILVEPIDDISILIGHEVSAATFAGKDHSVASNFLALGYKFR